MGDDILTKVFPGKSNKVKKKRTLRQTTLIMLTLVLLLFCAMFFISSAIIGEKTSNEYKTRAAETAARNAVSTIQASLTNYNSLTRMLMVNEKIVNYLKAQETDRDMIYEARRGIYEIQNLYSYIDSVYIFRNDGAFVGTERNVYDIDMESAEKQRILDARGGTVVAINGNGMIRKSTDEPLLTLSRCVYDINSQELIGMLYMNISSRYYEDTLIGDNFENLCIMDAKGEILCGNPKLAPFVHHIYGEEKISFSEITVDGKKKILAVTDEIDPLIVLSATDNTTRTISSVYILAMALPLAALLISLLVFTLFLRGNITGPIGKLSKEMEKTKSSGWLEKIDLKMPNRELEDLEESYNTMISSIQELFIRQLENEKNIQKAEMQVLQEQIKPHFLYNILETISYMSMSENAHKTHDALEKLGNFYRNFLNKGDREIDLKTEIRIVEDYLSLQKLRYGDSFEDEYDIAEETMDCMIPKLILQPMVENSIYHGIRLKGEKGLIRIQTYRKADALHIVVYDTGVGMDVRRIAEVLENRAKPEAKGSSAFGLAGTINRIRYFCNRRDVVKIESEPGEYTRIEIMIPSMWRVSETEEGNV